MSLRGIRKAIRMGLMTDGQFEEFFEPYANNVDHFYEASYWRLCDEIIRNLIRRYLGVGAGQRILDAGGGTARWAIWCARELGAHVTVADKSQAMLKQAQVNLSAVDAQGVADRVELVHCDIENAPKLGDETFDGLVSIYNMLSFNGDPARAFATLFRVLKPGGHGLVMGQGFANALASKFNRDHAPPEEIHDLAATSIVRWAPHVPPLRVYSTADLSELASQAGFEVRGLFAITALLMPGPEDFTYPYETMSTISKALDDPEYFQLALEQELNVNGLPGWGERGVNLMIHVRRP